MSNDINSSAAAIEAIAKMARSAEAKPIRDIVDGHPVVLFPGDRAYTSLEKNLAKPMRIRAEVAVLDATSLVDYVKKHKVPGTQLFGSATQVGGEFSGVLDYHLSVAEGMAMPEMVSLARWGNHRVSLKLSTTPEWQRWLGNNGKDLGQTEFAVFIEDNAQDIVVPESQPTAPNSTQMLDIALTLQAKTDITFASAKRLQDGQQRLTYNEMIDAKAGPDGTMAIPPMFYLSLPPFVGSARYLVSARLRFRVSGGRVTFRYELERLHKIVEAAFNDQRALIEKETELKVLLGTPTSINSGI